MLTSDGQGLCCWIKCKTQQFKTRTFATQINTCSSMYKMQWDKAAFLSGSNAANSVAKWSSWNTPPEFDIIKSIEEPTLAISESYN